MHCYLSVLILCVRLSAADFNLLLLHTNDMHARFQQADRYLGMCESDTATDCFGGFARIKAEVQRLKNEALTAGKKTIFLNAGDTFQGTPYYTFFKWPIVSEFIDMLGIDVMSLGNHEFDDGISSLSQYIKNVSVPVVCSNLNLTLEPSMIQPHLTNSLVLTVDNTKIGVIGYLTPDTKYLSNPEKVQILEEIPSISAEAQSLKKAGVNILIALGHSGYQMDQKIAQQVADIDLVVGGHSHTFLYSGTPPDPVDVPKGPYPTVMKGVGGRMVPVVQAYYGTKYLGYLELTFDDSGELKNWTGQPILLSGNLTQDADVLAALKPYEEILKANISRIVGYSNVILDNENYACKLGECNIGNFITDAMVNHATRNFTGTRGWTNAAIAIQQAGGIRSSINPKITVNHNGSITLGDVITVLPWGDNIVAKSLNGSVLLAALEFSVHRYENTVQGHVNEFLQVSGLKVVYNMSAPPGHRVVSVLVRCADCEEPGYSPLNTTKDYGVLMPEYLATGGDGYSMLQPTNTTFILDEADYMVLAGYIQERSPIYPTVEGRITIMYGTNGTSPSSKASSVSASWVIYLTTLVLCGTEQTIFSLGCSPHSHLKSKLFYV